MDPMLDPMWTCQEFEAALSDYREGGLAPERAAAARTHLLGCPACSALLAAVGEAMEGLGGLPELEPPASLSERIFAQTARPRPLRPPATAAWRRFWAPLRSPRFGMGLAMTVFACSLLLNAAQVNLRHVSLAPARVAALVQRDIDRAWAGGVAYYHDLRVVYEIQAALRQMRQPPAPSADHDHSQRQPAGPAQPRRLAQSSPVRAADPDLEVLGGAL